ncbi:MAG: glutamate synthase [Isosphaeraceae bacterium]
MENRPGAASLIPVAIPIPEIRDYRAINLEIVRLLEQGHRAIRLVGVGGQRLLAAGLVGDWEAVIDLDGDAGPELAAGLDSPGITVVGRGAAEDGAASGLRAGRVVVLGSVGTAFGYAQRGGLALAVGSAGPRAGLLQSGGDLVLLGDAGPMVGERQSGGRLFAAAGVGPHAGHGRRGGRLIRVGSGGTAEQDADRAAWLSAIAPIHRWLDDAILATHGADPLPD